MTSSAGNTDFPPSRSMRSLVVFSLMCVAMLALFVHVYGRSLSLPPSMIDEATHLGNAQKLWKNLGSVSLSETLRQDVSSQLRTYNPLFWFHSAILYKLTGVNRTAYHAVVLVQFLILLSVLLCLPQLAGIPKPAATIAGFVSCFLMMLADPPGWHTHQCLRAIWMYLHATDAPISMFVSLHVMFLCLAVNYGAGQLTPGHTAMTPEARNPMYKIWAFAALSSVMLLVATLLKPIFGALFVPVIIACVFLWYGRCGAWKPALICHVVGVAIALLQALLLHRLLADLPRRDSYGGSYVFTIPSIKAGLAFYAWCYRDTFGPLLIATLFGCPLVLLQDWSQTRFLRQVVWRNWLPLYLVMGVATATLVYVPWPHRLPRYLPTSVFYFTLLTGYLLGRIMTLNRPIFTARFGLVVASGLIMTLSLKITLLALVLVLTGIVTVARKSNYRWVSGIWMGVFITGFLYFGFLGLGSVRSLHDDYVGLEHVQKRAMEEIVRYGREKTVIGVIGDATDERFGSSIYLAELSAGVVPEIRSVSSLGDLKNVGVLMIAPGTQCPPEFTEYINSRSPDVIQNITYTDEPVSFWTWRRELWSGRLHFWHRVSLDNKWTFVTVGS